LDDLSSPTQTTILARAMDMDSFASVVEFANQCKEFSRIDGAILNAGVFLPEYRLSEGYESTMTINVISTFLLVTLLLPMMQRTAAQYKVTPHIAVVGSAVHAMAKHKDLTEPATGTIFKTLSDKSKFKWGTSDRYYLSKLPVMLLVKYLAAKLDKAPAEGAASRPFVVLNNVAPGFCNTGLFRDDHTNAVMAKRFGRSPEHGARNLVYGGTVGGRASHGQYISECQPKKASSFVRSIQGDQTAARLWQELKEIYERVQPGCTSVFESR
jgi:NAD(P)-dependent dehydrogenase (short-subunit alcohol dehydrogenase family)